ncbi:MAG: DsbC family protein [Burkholderiaceae bacterium]
MKTPWIAALIAAALFTGSAYAQAQSAAPRSGAIATPGALESEPAPPAVTKLLIEKVQSWIGDPRFRVEGVRTTPIPGFYEVQVRTDLFFVDSSGRYIIIEGEMVDMRTNQNITRERMKAVLAIDFSDLPIAKAIKNVNGDGKRVVALFEDPNCSYCRRLRADLNNIDNLTIYTFAYPILAADSDLKSRKALCAKDPSQAWNDLMMKGTVPENDGTCKTSLDEFVDLGQRWGISATPTVFFPSGHRLRGYTPPTQFVELLEKHQKSP